jgi:hypothetical protein
MGRRRDARTAELIEKAVSNALAATPMQGAGNSASTSAAFSQLMGVSAPTGIMQSLARDPSSFGGALGPGYPFQPAPLDQGYGRANRPAPRKFQYDVADNLNITKKLAQWNVLTAASVQVDIFARAITIRTDDVTKMDWSWNVSKSCINTIMEDNNVGYAEAAKIGRQENMAQIVRLSEFWENPYPQSDRSWEEWITEAINQVLVYDGLPVHPAFALGGDLLGLDIIDASTIKILLDNEGDFVRPPDPGFQQILFGFPRGEFIATPNKDVPTYLNGEYNITDRDQLSYFVKNRRTITPYGYSPVEMALEIANIYKERESWMLAEYKFGTSAGTYMKTGATEITLENLAGYNRIFNDFLQGSTAQRQSTVTLPPGFEPVFAPYIEEKYKADYDEGLIKRTAAFFGVDARQFGVVPRAGLGGGKGAAEGEADNAETVSSKPQNKYLERTVMSLSRRYLNANKMVQFDLKDDEGSEDEVEVATANNLFVSSGIKTRNEVRGELGMPLSTEPEADQLAITTATGPVFLPGLIAAQATAQEQAANPPTPIIQQIGPQNGAGNDSGGVDTDSQQVQGDKGEGEGSEPEEQTGAGGSAQAGVKAEIADFVKLVKSANRKGLWRRFEFSTVDASTADMLNDEGYLIAKGVRAMPELPIDHFLEKAGLAPHPKLLLKRQSDRKIQALAKGHSGFIRTALLAGVAGVSAAITHALGDSTGQDAKEVARQAVLQNVTFDSTQASQMLGNLYSDASSMGAQSAAAGLGTDVLSTSTTEQLLAQREITLNGIDNTAMGRISDAIANGIANGDTHATISDAVNAIIDDPQRADVISITESNRAYNSAFQDQLTAAGETQFDWIVDGDPCPACQDEEGPQDITNPGPPLHPNCECSVGVVGASS